MIKYELTDEMVGVCMWIFWCYLLCIGSLPSAHIREQILTTLMSWVKTKDLNMAGSECAVIPLSMCFLSYS